MHKENRTKKGAVNTLWNGMGCKAEGFGILGWPPPQKKAPSFRNENKYDIWTDKLIEMLPFIYSLITPWFYGENKKSYLRNNYRFLIWLYSKLDWGGGGREGYRFRDQKWIRWISNCLHSPSPLWILMNFYLVCDILCLFTRFLQFWTASLEKIFSF